MSFGWPRKRMVCHDRALSLQQERYLDTNESLGMFLWARLVLEYLSTNMFANKSEVMDAVDTLPRKLSELSVFNSNS